MDYLNPRFAIFFMLKKLLSIATLLLISMPVLMAQSFEFRYQGQSLVDGATVTISAEEDEWGFGEMCCYTNPSSNPNNGLILQMLSGVATQGSATLVIEENTLNPSRLLWCMGSTCVNLGSNTTYSKPFTPEDGICMVQFDAEDIQSEGHLLATLSATMGGETHIVKIKFINGEQQDNPIPGDVNGDNVITAADVTALYNCLLNDDYSNIVNGDQDGDNNITAGDITSVYTILLGN